MTDQVSTVNGGVKMAPEDQLLQVTIALAPYAEVMPAAIGLLRAHCGYTRVSENSTERQMARLDRLERERGVREPTYRVESLRILDPSEAAGITVLEDFYGTDYAHLGTLLPHVHFLHLFSEYEQKDAERHSYAWREGADVKRHVYFHHNYQEPGWGWEEAGEIQPWEDRNRLSAKRVSQRCDRALMLHYANRLGCDLHAVLAKGQWRQSILAYPIADNDLSETPVPTTLGEDHRKAAVAAGFGQGEEDISFAGQLADGHFHAAVKSHAQDVSEAVRKTRSAKRLLEVMTSREIAPDFQDRLGSDLWIWEDALQHAYLRFPEAVEIPVLEKLAKSETQNHRFPISDVRLENLRRSLSGASHIHDPEMMQNMVDEWRSG